MFCGGGLSADTPDSFICDGWWTIFLCDCVLGDDSTNHPPPIQIRFFFSIGNPSHFIAKESRRRISPNQSEDLGALDRQNVAIINMIIFPFPSTSTFPSARVSYLIHPRFIGFEKFSIFDPEMDLETRFKWNSANLLIDRLSTVPSGGPNI